MIKLIGIKYPKLRFTYSRGNDDVAMEIDHDDKIKPAIMQKLFKDGNDCVLINYNGKLYVCEKLDGTYTKREVLYHPLSSLVS